MKKVFSILLLLFFPLCLQAKYIFDETVYVPLSQEGWKIGLQKANEDGTSVTRYFLQSEDAQHWSKILNFQFRDREHCGEINAVQAMLEEQSKSPLATSKILTQQPNDVMYERSFPTGEQEIVRMVMTKKGLHRIAYIKKQSLDQSEEKEWANRLLQGVIGR